MPPHSGDRNRNRVGEVSIPVIDLRPSNAHAAPAQLLDAAQRFGFVFVANHHDKGAEAEAEERGSAAEIPPAQIARLFGLARDFFALPEPDKQRVAIGSNQAGSNHGWLRQGVEKLDPAGQKRADVKEAFNIGQPSSTTGRLEQPLPPLFAAHQDDILAFQARCHALCQRILRHLATALAIADPDWFSARHDVSTGAPASSIFRLLYYPARRRDTKGEAEEEEEEDLRAGAHSDYGSLTCLFQQRGQPGLEILTPEGQWAAVPVQPSSSAVTTVGSGKDDNLDGRNASAEDEDEDEAPLPILINIGDILEDWTGGLLKSTKHRVVFPPARAGGKDKEKHQSGQGGDRYSMAYFCHPLDDALLEPVPSEVVREYVARHGGHRKGGKTSSGRVITARDHLMERLAATYHVGG